jgi:hypothetical protein
LNSQDSYSVKTISELKIFLKKNEKPKSISFSFGLLPQQEMNLQRVLLQKTTLLPLSDDMLFHGWSLEEEETVPPSQEEETLWVGYQKMYIHYQEKLKSREFYVKKKLIEIEEEEGKSEEMLKLQKQQELERERENEKREREMIKKLNEEEEEDELTLDFFTPSSLFKMK